MMQVEAGAPGADGAFRAAAAEHDNAVRLPPPPKTVAETGLERSLIIELVCKVMLSTGRMHLPVLTGRLRLSINVLREVLGCMVAEQLVEVASRGDSDLDVYYQLTSMGKRAAADCLSRCRYAGPAPVTLAAYRELVLRQSLQHAQRGAVRSADLNAAFADDVVEADVRNLLGAALQSSRSLLLYGPSGSGKTTLARKLGQLQQGLVAVPFAILVDQDIVLVHDPLLHLPPTLAQARASDERRGSDSRWALCQRPVIQVGAELDSAMLDLRFDEAGGVYQAPPHLMANNGMLLVDDFGRQTMGTADLFNRWAAPLDTGADHLSLNGGHKVGVPFDVTLVFATNLSPQLLLDDSSMRRLGYKIHVGALSDANYRTLFRRECRRARIACHEDVLDDLVTRLHRGSGRELLACYPRELLGRVADFASFAGVEPRLTEATLEQAWSSMFALCPAGAVASSQPSVSFLAESGDPLLERIS